MQAACSFPPKHEYELAPGQAYSSDLETVLLVPINETEELPDGLEKGEEAVFRLVREYLEAHGLKVDALEAREFRKVWDRAGNAAERDAARLPADGVLREASPSDLISDVAETLETESDLIVVPNMIIRPGELKGSSMRWDGVRRRVESTEVGGDWSGTGSAASLHVAIFKADGTFVFGGFGGLDLLWRANISAARMELIEDRLEEEGKLREGVCVAFHPYFGMEEPCSRF